MCLAGQESQVNILEVTSYLWFDYANNCLVYQTPPPKVEPPSVTDDPDEVDITNHPYTSSRASPSPRYGQNNGPTEQDLRQLLRTGGHPPDMPDNPFMMPGMQGLGNARTGSENVDPMQMLMQMMGGVGGIPGGPNGGPGMGGDGGGLPPGFAELLGGGPPGGQSGLASKNDAYWKIIHGIFALSLGFYILSTETFTGSRIARLSYGSSEVSQARIFWIFSTAELVLQSTRFFLERGVGQSGILATIANFLPDPFKGYIILIARYSGIYTTIVEDAMVVIFMIGCVAWWQGATV
jgi:hypothetical protein